MSKVSKAYKVITDRIVDGLKKGNIPWKKTWKCGHMHPQNLVTKTKYKGINFLMTAFSDYSQPYWITYKGATSLEGEVRKGEKGTPIVYWKFFDCKECKGKGCGECNNTGRAGWGYPLYSTVFNVEQCDGLEEHIPTPEKLPEFNPDERCDQIFGQYVEKSGVNYVEGQNGRAYYRPSADEIHMPDRQTFDNSSEYYSTLFHEMTHSTGIKDRMNREGVTDTIMFGSHNYSFEELVAEIGSCFLSSESGIESIAMAENSQAYINGWIEKLESNPKMIVQASGLSQKAVDYILDIK